MKHIIAQVLKSLFVLAIMTVGFIFVGSFVEYKTLNGANIFAGVLFGFVVCSVIATTAYITVKEILKGQWYV